MTTALELYEACLADVAHPLVAVYPDGLRRELPVGAWMLARRPGDDGVLDRCSGPTLDVGCGPGRLTVALARRGVPALGVDIAPLAVRMARSRGALVLSRSVFARMPGHGRWATAVLADGNVGIGGNPVGLLWRVRELLAPQGSVVVELDPPGSRSGLVKVRVEHGGRVSDSFTWAHVPPDAADLVAGDAGFVVREHWEEVGRWFCVLGKD